MKASASYFPLACAASLVLAAVVAGCGGVSSSGASASEYAVVVVTMGPAGTQDPLDVPATVVCGGVKAQYEPNDAGMVVIQNVPYGDEDPPRQPLTVTARGYRTASQWVELSRTTATYVDVPLEPVDLQRTGTVQGTVTDQQTGAPIVNCLVRFTQVLPTGKAVEVEAYTAADGSFIAGGIPIGQAEVLAAAPGYLQHAEYIVVAADEGGENPALNIQLVSGQARVDVRGTVRDLATGQPLEGATVAIDDQSTQTGPDGQFVVPDVLVGTHHLTVTAEGYDRYEQDITVLPGMADLLIELTLAQPEPPPGPYNVTGSVTIRNRPDNSGARVEAFNLQLSLVLDSYVTGPDGRYYLFVPPGEYEIRVYYEDRYVTRQLTVPGGGRIVEGVDFIITMPPE